MMIKEHTHHAVVHNYFYATGKERRFYNRGSKIFYEKDTLYSFGYHFSLAVKCRNGYVLNGDTYSSTTSGHQSLTRSIAERHKQETTTKSAHHCVIPVSALQGAEIKPEDVFILDVNDDSWVTIKRKNPKTTEREEHQVHHLGASLIRIGTRRYLSSLDTSSRKYTFYLVELQSRRVNTVSDAFRDLAGNLTDQQYQDYQQGNIIRQGEYFLESHPELSTKNLKKYAKRIPTKIKGVNKVVVKTPKKKRLIKDLIRQGSWGYGGITKDQVSVLKQNGIPYYVIVDQDHNSLAIPKDAIIKENHLMTYMPMVNQYDLSDGVGNPHMARDAILTPNGLYIRGTLRHPEHRMIRMNNTWHRVYKNTARNSWSASGNVD